MAATSDHFDGRRFFNPTGPEPKPFTAVPKLLLERQTTWPAIVPRPSARPEPRGEAAAALTFIGHSTFLIQTAEANMLTDPMYSERAGPWNRMGPRRARPPAVRLEDLPPIHVVLLSHNHYDHLDRRTLQLLAERFDPLVVTPLGNGRLVRASGIRRVEELDWWQQGAAAPLPITLTPAHHFSARHPWDRNRALWGGFVLTTGGRRIYFAGDTAYAPFFAEIGRRLGPIDLALLPIGAYEPRWFMRAVHVNPAEAVQAFLDLDAGEAIGMHHGTFQLTNEGIDEPVRALGDALRAHGMARSRFRAIEFGATVRLA